MPRTRNVFYVARWSAAGASLGIFFVLLAWWIGNAAEGTTLTLAELHTAMPVMWIVDLAPTMLGLAGVAIGVMHERIKEAQRRTEQLAEEIASAWTSDLQRVNAELAEALDDQERLYAAVSHELRTPLTSILGYTELAGGLQLAPSEASQYIHEIYRSASFLLQMVNELLEVAKLSHRGMTVSLDDVDGSAVVHNVVSLLRPLALSAGIQLRVEQRATTGCRADAVRLRQTLTNLIANAIKYSGAGTVTVRTGVEGDVFSIEVIDAGAGIDPESLERIFGAFEQQDDRSRTDSSGLGLAVSRSLVEAMGGTLTAHSEGRGTGATFRVTLAVADGSGSEERTARLAGTSA